MRLQSKFAYYNIFTKIAVILSIALFFELSVERVIYNHLDTRITQKKDKFIKDLSRDEIKEYLHEQDTDFASYDVLKEEYIILKPISPELSKQMGQNFTNETRLIEDEKATFRILTYPFVFDKQHYQLEIGESLSSIKQLKTSLRNFTALILLITILLTFLSDILFTGWLLQPLKKIINARLKDVNDPIHFNFTDIPSTTTDFIQLDQSLVQMQYRIKHTFLAQKEFNANVSHELLTPISILSNRFENILNEPGISDELQNKIYASIKTLNGLKKIINSLLLISKVENDQFVTDETVNLHDLIKEVIEEVEYRLEEKSISVNVQIEQEIRYKCNHTLLHTLFFNIINNAIKYNKRKGFIHITDQLQNGFYQLTIEDTGQGIDKEKLALIFNRFEKLDSVHEESFGLGLAIVRSIAQFHNIKLNIQSEVGKGTRFLVLIPLS
ncbi:sensor histidine kinase [Solitalea koreensis]|uniref:histidine kinase n=1 Tax=Solitalea koreensis TaxID=543615 RepID=A0A521D1R2_9SPHI|nr:HAMP domain-containing sensor histidine kinase [Solitalea koreensis]SMO64941.1 Signal transduction histidine kinase [Solitalea koreensis]